MGESINPTLWKALRCSDGGDCGGISCSRHKCPYSVEKYHCNDEHSDPTIWERCWPSGKVGDGMPKYRIKPGTEEVKPPVEPTKWTTLRGRDNGNCSGVLCSKHECPYNATNVHCDKNSHLTPTVWEHCWPSGEIGDGIPKFRIKSGMEEVKPNPLVDIADGVWVVVTPWLGTVGDVKRERIPTSFFWVAVQVHYKVRKGIYRIKDNLLTKRTWAVPICQIRIATADEIETTAVGLLIEEKKKQYKNEKPKKNKVAVKKKQTKRNTTPRDEGGGFNIECCGTWLPRELVNSIHDIEKDCPICGWRPGRCAERTIVTKKLCNGLFYEQWNSQKGMNVLTCMKCGSTNSCKMP